MEAVSQKVGPRAATNTKVIRSFQDMFVAVLHKGQESWLFQEGRIGSETDVGGKLCREVKSRAKCGQASQDNDGVEL